MHAWAHAMSAGEAVEFADRFPGLGLVLSGRNIEAVERLTVPPVAYVTTREQAEVVRAWIDEGYAFRAVIVNDERNAAGPSGAYLTPAEYARVFTPVYEALRGVVPVHTMGLMSVSSAWWHELFWRRQFDDAYHARLPEADGRAFNPNKVARGEVQRVLRMSGPWVLSPAPFRGWFDRWRQAFGPRDWAQLARHPNVTAVALWCAREVKHGSRWQAEHGLVDRHGRLTVVGREVANALGGIA